MVSLILVFSSLRLCDFLYNVFRLQGKMGKTKWKRNILLRNALVTLSPKTTKNEVTKMGWNPHSKLYILVWDVDLCRKEFGIYSSCVRSPWLALWVQYYGDIKRGLISESIFTLVPSLKKTCQTTVFYFSLTFWRRKQSQKCFFRLSHI